MINTLKMISRNHKVYPNTLSDMRLVFLANGQSKSVGEQ